MPRGLVVGELRKVPSKGTGGFFYFKRGNPGKKMGN